MRKNGKVTITRTKSKSKSRSSSKKTTPKKPVSKKVTRKVTKRRVSKSKSRSSSKKSTPAPAPVVKPKVTVTRNGDVKTTTVATPTKITVTKEVTPKAIPAPAPVVKPKVTVTRSGDVKTTTVATPTKVTVTKEVTPKAIPTPKPVVKPKAILTTKPKTRLELFNKLPPSKQARYRLLRDGVEKDNYLLDNQPKTFVLPPKTKIVKGKIVSTVKQTPEIKATNLVLSRVKKIPWKTDKGTARLMDELNKAKISLELFKGKKGTFKNQISSALGNTILGLGRGVVNLLTVGLNPIDTTKNFSKFIVLASKNPQAVANEIVNAFIEDPYGYIGETITEGFILGKIGKYARQSKVARYINEEKFIRSINPSYRDAVKKIVKGAKAQEKLAPNKGSVKNVDFFEVRELNPIDAKALQKTLKETDSIVFGSVTTRAISGKKTKLPKDVDLGTKNVQLFNKKFMDNLPASSRSNYKVSKEKIVRISDGAKILDVKPFERLYPNKIAISGQGELPIYKISSQNGKPTLKQVPTIFTTQKPVKVGGIKLTSFGEQTTRKALGTLQVILEKQPRRAKDPSALLELLQIQRKALKLSKPKTKIGSLSKTSKIKKLDSAIKLMKSKDFAKLLDSKVPGLTKEYPLVSKINTKKLKNIARKPIKKSVSKKAITRKATARKVTKRRVAKKTTPKKPVTKKITRRTAPKKTIKQISRLPRKTISRLPIRTISRLPISTISRLPIRTISRLPISTISRLPLSTISRLPLSTISRLPISTISRLPIPTISRLPIPTISKLPITTISRLPITTTSKLPLPTISRLPPAIKRKIPIVPPLKPIRLPNWDSKLPKGYSLVVNARYKKGNKIYNKFLKTTPNRARKVMNKFVDNNIIRSYDLVVIGKKKIKDVKRPSMAKFRQRRGKNPRVRITVEKAKFSLDSRGERKQIAKAKKRKTTKRKVTRKPVKRKTTSKKPTKRRTPKKRSTKRKSTRRRSKK